jgi:hypothetical protein
MVTSRALRGTSSRAAQAWLVAVVAVGCGGAADRHAAVAVPEPVAAVAGPPALGFHPGESMQFEVTLGGITAGEAALAVGEPGDIGGGNQGIAIRSRLATVGAAAMIKKVVDDATTVMDIETRRPVSMTTDVEYGNNRYNAVITFTGSKVDVAWKRKHSENAGKVHFDFKEQIAHDAHSAMAEIREWRAKLGERRTVWVVGGRRLWRADLTMGPSETLGTKLGNRATVRLDGIAYRARGDLRLDASKKARKFTVWVSDDADRVPLRVQAGTELGDVVIELVDYQKP